MNTYNPLNRSRATERFDDHQYFRRGPVNMAVGPHIMDTPRRQSWFGIAIVIGILYGVIGIVFALPANEVRMWRLAAWVVSAALYATHIGYEHLRLRNPVLAIASHAAVAVAIGAFMLASAATIHKAVAASPAPYSRFLLALIVWPIVTATPAFVVALFASMVLARLRQAA